jgi:putative transcriptional regulator
VESGFLIASPQLRDPNFQRTLVLLIQHNQQGALGLIINREAPMRLGDVVEQLESVHPARANRPVLWGGPVDRGVGFVIFRGRAEEGWGVGGGISVSTSSQRLQALVSDRGEFHLCLGYAGWGPGQLDREYEEGSWLHTECIPDLLFDCAVNDRYDRALAGIGLSAETLWMNPVNE